MTPERKLLLGPLLHRVGPVPLFLAELDKQRSTALYRSYFVMNPSLGWTLLSREALKRAESQLNPEQGVRDEIGFLLLHQAYSDRFFPGTSVLHTRVRYAIFVPLIYRDASAAARRGDVEASIAAHETALTWRLKQANMADGAGIIGGKIHPRPAVQSPSMIYWNALSTWGILCPYSDGSVPTRSAVNRAIARGGAMTVLDDDEAPLEERNIFFSDVPEPALWRTKDSPLNFDLSNEEKKYLKKRIGSALRDDEEQSLLARMVETGFFCAKTPNLWSRDVLRYADKEDKKRLLRASQTSSMAAIGRAVYDALVESMRTDDKEPGAPLCRDYLELVKARHKDQALALEVDSLREDIPAIPAYLSDLLKATQKWIGGPRPVEELWAFYEHAERSRKKGRARLSNIVAAKQRRRGWEPPAVAVKKEPDGEPLHFRWPVVTRLLHDMGNK